MLYGKTDRSLPTIIGADAWLDRWIVERFNLTGECVKGFGNDVFAVLTLTDQMLDQCCAVRGFEPGEESAGNSQPMYSLL